MKLMLSMTIQQKLLGVSFIFAVPVLLLLYFMISGIHDDIEFTRQELRGTQVLQSLYDLRVALPRQTLLQQRQSGDAVLSAAKLKTHQQRVANLFAQVQHDATRYAQTLQLDAQGMRRAHLKPLDALANTWSEQGATAVAQDLKRWYQRVGDSSNLILDPDLDSYYLMDVILLALPESIERVAEILHISGHDQHADTQLQRQILSAQLLDSLARIQHSIATTLREDAQFYGSSPSLQVNLPNALNDFTTQVQIFATQTTMPDAGEHLFAAANRVFESATDFWQITRTELDSLLHSRIAAYEQKRLLHVSISLGVFMLALLAIYAIARTITQRLAKANSLANQVAAGDLTCEIRHTGQDEIGMLLKNIRRMVNELNALLSQTQQSVLTVSASATQLAASAREQEAVMQHQVHSTEAVLASSEYIVATSQELAETITAIAELSNISATMAHSGQTDLVRMRDAIHHMESASRAISEKLEKIHAKADSITSVVITITKVAEQTNLLSLNAAIEAEKAGEYGRGFTVVAQEIRRLADQTAVATLDIEAMVEEMQQAVVTGVTEMNEFIHRVQLSVDDVDTVSDKLNGIIERVQTLAPSFTRLQTGADSQLGHIHQIKDAMLNLNEETVQVGAALHESYLSIEQLNEAVAGLNERVQHFKVR